MDDYRNAQHIVAVVREHVRTQPHRPALTFVVDPERPDEAARLCYGEADADARRIAAGLQERCQPGDRIVLLYPPGLPYVTAFLGCVYAGMVAVLGPLPERPPERRRVLGIIDDARAAAVLTTGEHATDVSEWLHSAYQEDFPCLATDVGGFGAAERWRPPALDQESVALLQYTSGSTSQPRGVELTHRNLLHNAHTISQRLGLDADTRMGGWIPLFHDMSLLGLVTPSLLNGGSVVLMGPATFLKYPHRWLQLIDRFDIAVSAAPNFAYEACTRRITDEQLAGIDLSRWRRAVNGSEPVRAATLAAFATRFAAAGFRAAALMPCFGMAESTVFVSGTPDRPPLVQWADPEALARHEFRPGDEPTGRAVVSCGAPAACEVRVIDPQTRTPLPDGQIGEVVIRSASVARGYRNNPAATAATFDVTLADGDRGYLRTGDLGTLHNGELYITGRIKETIVVRGRNLYPQDIEHELRARHPELTGGVGAVFGVPAADGDQIDDGIVVIHEIRGRHEPELLRRLTVEMRRSVVREFGVSPAAVLLVRPGAVRRTTSGKIQRTAMRELFQANELEPVYAEPAATAGAGNPTPA